MGAAYLNQIETSVPEHDIHAKFIEYAPRLLTPHASDLLFQRMSARTQIDHRYSFLEPHASDEHLDTTDFYQTGQFPSVELRMQFFQEHAFSLATKALDRINLDNVTHILVTTCTGFYAPGLDLEIIKHYGLKTSIERTVIGFMGCYAALNALKLARHIVRSDGGAKVLILNLELCTLHLQPVGSLESILSFLIFGDGCAASIISSAPKGLELKSFHTAILPDSAEQITWNIGNLGFEMNLSGRVPATIASSLPSLLPTILGDVPQDMITYWAIHPGGRSILDAVRDGAQLNENDMAVSRDILRRYGNMSSATIMFVLEAMMKSGKSGEGCAMAFGPGLTVESMRFSVGDVI
jgi:predicted naringenin-chalcone synthase